MASVVHPATWTVVLTRRDIHALMSLQDYFDAVQDGFAALGAGRAHAPAPLHLGVDGGGFHAKAAYFDPAHSSARGPASGPARSYVAVKFNGNFPANPARHDLPTIQGAILLCDGDDGRLLAVLDSIEVTLRRTAAATALAARHLARPDSAVLAVCGCGAQALPQIEALLQVLPLRQVLLWDGDAEKSHRLRQRLASRTDLDVQVAAQLSDATRRSDAIVTCTTSREAFLGIDHLSPGVFIAAVGADSPSKSELTPRLMAASKLVADSLAQCAEMGDLHHAINAGAMQLGQVHAELSELVCGVKAGRTDASEVCIFDSTGVAVQDVASAARAFERACERAVERGFGLRVELGREPIEEVPHAALLQ